MRYAHSIEDLGPRKQPQSNLRSESNIKEIEDKTKENFVAIQ